MQLYNPVSNGWSTASRKLLADRWDHYACRYDANRIFVVGGSPAGNAMLYREDTDTWSWVADTPYDTSQAHGYSVCHTVVLGATGERVLVVAGGDRMMNEVYFYNGNSWRSGPPLPKNNKNMGPVIVGGDLVLIGGNGNKRGAWQLAPDGSQWIDKPDLGSPNPQGFSWQAANVVRLGEFFGL